MSGLVFRITQLYQWNCPIMVNMPTTLTVNKGARTWIPLSDVVTVVYREHPHFSPGHHHLSVHQELPSVKPLNANAGSGETRFCFTLACQLRIYTNHAILHPPPHRWWFFPSLCPKTMVWHNSSSVFFDAPYFREAINYFLGCRVNGKVTDFLCAFQL